MTAPITLTGRLGADPDMKFTKDGKAIANLRMATNKRRKLDNGDWEDVDTTWWTVSAFGTLAQNIADTLAKGDAVIVVGNIKQREWTDKTTGDKRTAMEVIANQVGPDLSKGKPKTVNSQADDVWGAPAPTHEVPF